MNKYFTEKMNESWRDWHRGIEEENIPESPNPSFHRGFEAAISIVMPILRGSSIAAEALSDIVAETRKLNLYDIPTDPFQNLRDTLKAVTS
jgi:hypothetical protein